MAGSPPDPGDGGDSWRALLTPAKFSIEHFRWTPYPFQEEVMDAILLHRKRRVAWVAGRRAGKTVTMANVALQLAIHEPGKEIAIFAPTRDQAKHLFTRAKDMLYGSRFRRNVVRENESVMHLRFGHDERGKPRESVITARPLTNARGTRGGGADVLIFDESAFLDGEDYRSKAMPYVLDRPEAVIVHISTPWSEDDHFSEALEDYAQREDGAVFVTPSWKNPDVSQAYLAELRGRMREAEYMREVECVLVPDNGVFDRRLMAPCLRDYELLGMPQLAKLAPKRHHEYFVGVDWGKKQDRAVVAVVERGTQEKANPARLVFLQVYDPDPDNPRHYSRVLGDLRRLDAQVRPTRVVADLGEGAMQAEILEQDFRRRFVGFRFTTGSRDGLVDNVRLLVERQALILPKRPEEVWKAFMSVYRGEKGYEHTNRQSKDLFDAIALALAGMGGAGAAEPRETMKLLRASPGGHGWEGPTPEIKLDLRRVMFPPDVWHLVGP